METYFRNNKIKDSFKNSINSHRSQVLKASSHQLEILKPTVCDQTTAVVCPKVWQATVPKSMAGNTLSTDGSQGLVRVMRSPVALSEAPCLPSLIGSN